jgi:membrane fusion protein (multidrug efflux system)
MPRLRYLAPLAALPVVLAAAVFYMQQREAENASPALEAQDPDPVVSVEAEAVTIDTVQDIIRAVATLEPNESVVIAPEIAGRIVRLPFAEGDLVGQGDALAALDAGILRAELDKAKAELTLAQANRDRLTTLAKLGTDSLRARDEAVAAFGAAEASAALARLRLERSTLRAPFSGVVGVRSVSVGAFVSPGQAIVELIDTDPIKVDFRIPELALSSLRVGQSVRVSVDALPGETFVGEVYVIDPLIDANGRAVHLRARIPNPERRLSPGLFARVALVVGETENAILIPESAVFSRGQERYAYRVVDGRAVQTRLELGQRRPGEVQVRQGLSPEAVVVTAGQQKLRDGSRVRIIGAGSYASESFGN